MSKSEKDGNNINTKLLQGAWIVLGAGMLFLIYTVIKELI